MFCGNRSQAETLSELRAELLVRWETCPSCTIKVPDGAPENGMQDRMYEKCLKGLSEGAGPGTGTYQAAFLAEWMLGDSALL